MRFFAAIFVAAVAMTSPAMAQHLAVGSGQFEREEAAGATAERQRVFYHRPEAWRPGGRVVVVMHGVNRDADRYRDEWRALADQYGFLLVVPEFSQTKFPGDDWYNFGGMVDEQGKPRKIEVVQGVPGPYGFDDAAREAALECTFAPGRKGGRPAAGWVSLSFVFKARNR